MKRIILLSIQKSQVVSSEYQGPYIGNISLFALKILSIGISFNIDPTGTTFISQKF